MPAPVKDRAEKYLEAYPDVFADIANVLIFRNPVIQEEELVDGPTEAVYKSEGGKEIFEQRRDTAKYAVKAGVAIALIGIENQSVVDSAFYGCDSACGCGVADAKGIFTR